MDKKFFMGANTADGVVHFFGELVDAYELKKLYILKGGSGIGKSTFIRRFATAFADKHGVDYFYCSGDPKSLDGAIIPELKIGIIDGTAPHMVDPKYPGVIDEIIDLGCCIKPNKISKQKLQELYAKKSAHYAAAFDHLHQAREVHMELEALYKGKVDFTEVRAKLDACIDRARNL